MNTVNIFGNKYEVWSESCCGSSSKRTLYLEITTVCNAKCNFCTASKEPSRYISLEFVKEILDELVVNKGIIDRISITGGEPLMYPDLEGLLALIDSYELDHVAITTNGFFLEKKMPILEKFDKLKYINVSKPGSNSKEDREIFGCKVPDIYELKRIIDNSTKSFRINTIIGLDSDFINMMDNDHRLKRMIHETSVKLNTANMYKYLTGVDNVLVRFNYNLNLSETFVDELSNIFKINRIKTSDKCKCITTNGSVELRYVDMSKEYELESNKEYIRNFIAKSDNHLYGGWSDKAVTIK